MSGLPHSPLSRRLTVGGAAVLAAAGLIVAPTSPAVADPDPAAAPGGPGVTSRFDLARKDCVGTARNDTSKVWFTIADGVLSDVYEPTIDNTNVQSMQYVVTDGKTFTDLQQRDMTYTVRADATGMSCTVVATSAAHHYSLTTTYIADPAADAVRLHTTVSSSSLLSVYVRLDAHVNGNGGGGADNGGADDGRVSAGVPVIGDPNTATAASNRDYAVPTYMALASPTLSRGTVGYAGTASDGLVSLDATHGIGRTYRSADNGHIVATASVADTAKSPTIDVALGFGRNAGSAVSVAQASAARGFAGTANTYRSGWTQYDAHLTDPGTQNARDRAAYYLSANVLRASLDKTFPGALVASLASPWGQAVDAGALVNGKPVYFGSYREIFARDLYEGATGFLAAGDIASAQATDRFLFERQQLADGRMPRNSLLNGEVAPDTGGDQLDETAYPILLAYLSGLGHDGDLYPHVVRAADFVVAHGPSFGNERWEEQGGYSPSTIAAEIAGLVAASVIARSFGDDDRAQVYAATADDFQRTVKSLTVTSDGPYSSSPYFIRLSKNGDPNSDYTYNLGNGSIDVDQKAVVDGGFQELVRLGELSPSDPDVVNSLRVFDAHAASSTPTGTGYYRYATNASDGSVDGYGDCWTPDPTNCPKDGQPWPTTDTGSGHLWPVLSGERAETAIAQGDSALATSQLAFMRLSASGVGLVPEQAWENPDLAADPYGTDPTTASIGFQDGHAAGSASPLTWAQAQLLRLIRDRSAGQILDRPDITTDRYVTHAPPANLPTTITSPTAGATVRGSTRVTGTTAPNSHVVISSTPTDAGGTAQFVTTAAAANGRYSASVPVGFGADVITVTAARGKGTGYAQVTVVGDLVGGATVLDITDPANDDHGPGTFQYPTASDFADGSFDITRFQVLTSNGTVYLRTTLRNLVNTFGSPLGAQLLDVYVRDPAVSATSTTAAYASRNYSLAPSSAWSERLEVQGFAAPVWVDANGNSLGTAAVVASTAAKTITIALPESTFGTPDSGWIFSTVLHGQDGFSGDQARGFAPTPQPYAFGLCAEGGTSPICSIDPATAPKAMDVTTPSGTSQSVELDPTRGPVIVKGVTVG